MLRRKLTGALIAVVMLACVQARADLPALPPNAIGDSTIAVIHLSPGKFDPAAIKASVKAILGPQAAMADAPLAEFEKKFNELTGAGVQSMTMVMGMPAKKGDEPIGAAYVGLKPGADAAAVQKAIEADMKGPAEQSVEHVGNFLVIHKKDQALPEKGSADQQKAIGAAMADAGDKAIVIAFAPTDATRAQLTAELADNKEMQGAAADAAAAFINAKWATVSITLGDAPALGAVVQASDEGAAKKLLEQINNGLKEAQDKAKETPFGPMFNPVFDAVKPTQTGTRIAMNLDGKVLTPIVQVFAAFAGQGQKAPPGPPQQ